MANEKSFTGKKISVVVLNWNGIDDTLKCIESVKRLDYPDYDIVVLDNGSKGDDIFILKKVKGINFIDNKDNLGFAEGNNVGINYALKNGADAVFLLNNDTLIDSKALKHLALKLFSDDKIGIVGPKIYYFDNKTLWFAGGTINYFVGDPHHIGDKELDHGQYNKESETDYITGAAMLVKKEVFDKIGLLDKDFFAFYEELDFNVRARKAGFGRWYVPKAKVKHKVSASAGRSSPMIIMLNMRNRLIFMRKNAPWYSWFTFPFFYLFTLVSLVIYKLFKLEFKCVSAALVGFFQGLAYRKKKVTGLIPDNKTA